MPNKSSDSVKVTYPRWTRDELVERLRAGVLSLSSELPVIRAALFGSWAAGRATAFSDIDLLVVYRGPERADAFEAVHRHLRLRGLEPHVYSEEEAGALTATLSRMTRDAIPLYPG